ncbi:glycosyltransferase family 4 protein [Candidatus Peregrinibacteria bacterium]|nr:glycosyltransferase family 4 protein [Candidatus Peregrinibacteria bacterium]
MKIGIDARMYSTQFTGIGRYVYELIRNLAEIETSLPKPQKNEYVLFFNDPEYERFQCPNKFFHKIRVNARHYSFDEQMSYLQILRLQKLDIMHFTHFNAPIFYHAPSIVTIHDLILSFFPGKKMTKPWHRFGYHFTLKSILRNSKKIIAVSQHTKQDIIDLYNIPPEKIQVVYEAVSPEFRTLKKFEYEHVKKLFHLDRPFILYAGVHRNHKNLVNLVRAFHLLRTQYQRDILLVMTGKEDLVFYPEVREAVRDLKMEPFVRFPGMIEEKNLVALYNAALTYVQPSFYEGFGLNILEAFACGCPVVASNTSCMKEIAGANNALFFHPKNYHNMAEVMHSLISDPSLQTQLKERGKFRIKDFSWRKMASETLHVYTS